MDRTQDDRSSVKDDDDSDMFVPIANPPTTIAAAAATAAATAIAVDAEVTACSTVVAAKETEVIDANIQDEVDSDDEEEKPLEALDDSSDDEGEFVNCSQTLDDMPSESEMPRAVVA